MRSIFIDLGVPWKKKENKREDMRQFFKSSSYIKRVNSMRENNKENESDQIVTVSSNSIQ